MTTRQLRRSIRGYPSRGGPPRVPGSTTGASGGAAPRTAPPGRSSPGPPGLGVRNSPRRPGPGPEQHRQAGGEPDVQQRHHGTPDVESQTREDAGADPTDQQHCGDEGVRKGGRHEGPYSGAHLEAELRPPDRGTCSVAASSGLTVSEPISGTKLAPSVYSTLAAYPGGRGPRHPREPRRRENGGGRPP